VTVLAFPDAPERLALALRGAGYITADEIVELDEWEWALAASIANVPLPNTAIRCCVVALMGLPVGVPSRVSESGISGSASLVTAPESVGPSWHSGMDGPTDSTSQRKAGT